MSKIKKLNLTLFFLIALCSSIMFGCGKTTPVKEIFFNLNAGEQIVLIVGESLEMDDYVSFKPSDATNKKYSLSSFDEDIVRIENGSIVAVSEGRAQIKLVSKDNKLKQDLMTVVVKNTKTTLTAPRNLIFNRETQLLTFDKVTYATSYTLKINNEEIQLGNSNVFSMAAYDKSAVNNLLNIQVKANSPTYTKALEDSEYSAEYQIYQAGGVENIQIKNGILSFDKTFNALKVNLYLGNLLVVENSSASNFSLRELSEDYTGVSTQVQIETIVTDEIKENYSPDVNYFNSTKQVVNLNILDVPIVSVGNTTLSWQNIPYAAGYSLLIDDEEVAQIQENYIDLKTLDDFSEIISTDDVHTIVVDPIINDLTLNVGKTVRVNPIRVKRLAETYISCEGYGVQWQAVENALSYSFILESDETYLEISTTLNNYSLLGQNAGDYHLTVQAVGGYVEAEDVYYISSKTVTKDFVKYASVTAEIEDYVLKVSDLGTATCYVSFDNSDFNTTLTGDGAELDLTYYTFNAGENTITLAKKEGEDSVLSENFVLKFVQLEAVSNLRIEDYFVKFENSVINANATITLETSNQDGVVYSIENIESSQHKYNSENVEGENYLTAGDYTASIYVTGDGVSTFSVRVDGEDSPATVNFTVLDVPVLALKSVKESTLLMQGVNNAIGFDVYLVGEESTILVGENITDELEFELFSGSVSYKAQSKGDGSRYLNSVIGEPVTIERLQSPTLTYNSDTSMFAKEDLNDPELVANYELTINGEVVEYDFVSSVELLEDATVTLTTIPVDEKDGTLYLSSIPTELVLTKISNEVEFILWDSDYNLISIYHTSTEEYAVEVEFVFGEDRYLLKSDEEKNLLNEDGEFVTFYDYMQTTEELEGSLYDIWVMQNDRFIYEGLHDEFKIRVRFINKSTGDDTLINSEFTPEVSVEFGEIVNDVIFTINENNQLVIYSEMNFSPRGLILVVNDDEDLTFRSDGQKLVSNNCESTYTYDYMTQSYYINLLDDGYNVCDEAFNSDFTMKVKLTLYQDTTEASRDTDFSEEVTVHTLPLATITRDGQNLKITHPQNDYAYNNYGLLINNKYLLTLTEDSVTQGEGCILVNMNYVFDNTPSNVLSDTNTVAIIVRNIASTESYLELSKRGNTLSIQKTPKVQLRGSKNNGVDDNSVVIEFNTYETTYNKDYYVTIYNDSGVEITTMRFSDDDANENGVISFKLDNIESLTDVFYIEAYVSCLATDGTNEVFSSDVSNRLEFTKIQATSELRVSESVLTFAEVENAVGYEVYEKTGTGYVKLNTGLISTNQYTFGDLAGTKEIVVKAISIVDGYTNSSYSESIRISAMSALKVKVENGEFYVTFPSQVLSLLGSATLVPEITNELGEVVEIDLGTEDSNITLVGFTQLRISPYALLAYNTESLQSEDFLFRLKVRYDETERNIYYLNTSVVEITAHGLLAPTEVRKTTDNNTKVEFVTWTPNEKNTINNETVEVGYEFKLEYIVNEETQTYYSTDTMLKYYNSATDEYLSYDAILTDTNIVFPAGYDSNDDGELDVEFGAGKYRISVRAVPNSTISGYNFCNSLYASASEFEILEQTTVTMEDGTIKWEGQDNANKYKVEVYEDGETSALVTDYVTKTSYDFSNSALNGFSGVLRTVVTAISDRDDTLCGQASDSIYVYRLPEATNVQIDDGQLIVSANKFFSKAEIEFVDRTTNKTYIETYENFAAFTNISGLGIITWAGFNDDAVINDTFKFALALDGEVLEVLDGRDYTINVKLYGNSNEQLGTVTSSKAINLSALTATKMNPNLTEVSLGVLQYAPNANYATITKTPSISYTSLVDLNYSFNGATSTDFWHNTAVYKIKIAQSNSFVNVYAVDYYSLMSAISNGLIESDEYEILDRANGLYAIVKYNVTESETIYFNVYLENKLNLRDFDEISYYEVQETLTNGENEFSSLATEKTVKFADGGSFVITITMLGGDSQAVDEFTVGQLNAGVNKLKTFIRYGGNELSSNNGKIQFSDLLPMVDEEEKDNPVYKLVVTPFNTTNDQVFYLYYTSEEDARTVAARHDEENYLTATYINVETNADFEGVLFFDLSQYITAGTYKVTIRTLAGLGNGSGDDADYLLNAKAPTTAYTFYKLSDAEFIANEGVLEFEQSYIVRDSNVIYSDNYEITFYDHENNSYVYTINRTSENVQFDDTNHIVRYSVPSQLTFDEQIVPIEANKEYKIKIKAIGVENFILSGTYAQTADVDKVYTFTKSQGVENLRIEDGILKWTVLDVENHINTVIKLTFLDTYLEPHNIYITVGDLNKVEINGEYQYHYYEFTSEKFNGYKIQSGVDYTISAYTTGQGDILNSNYCVEFVTYRLATVESSSIKTIDGILTWDLVDDAQSYEVTINGETYESYINSIDITKFNLPAGTYSVNIKAIGTNRINSESLENAVEGFVQLGKVAINSIKVGGNKISWDAVESAQGYKIVFNYVDLAGNTQTLEEIVTANEFVLETTGMQGTFTTVITAIGLGEGKVFNGQAVEYTSSSNAPMQVASFGFDNVNHRFVVDVNNTEFLSSDSLLIVYNFEEYTSQSETTVARRVTTSISYQQTESYEVVDENITRYYLPVSIMGKYTNIYVQVDRPNTLSSNKTQTDDIDFHIFSYGAGTYGDDQTEANPYRIYNAEQLLNISCFPTANYVLISSINLSGIDISARLAENNAVIAKEFSGVLDGANFSILGFNIDENSNTDIISLENVTNFALFETLNRATIKNLVIGKENIQLILSNTFAAATSDVIKLSLIATGANNSTIENIKVLNYKIEFKQDSLSTKRAGGIYVGGLINEITNTTIKDSVINFTANIDANISTDVEVYIGGVSAIATTSNVNNTKVKVNIETKSSNLLTYVGGVFAYFVGNTAKSTGITRSTAELNMTNVQSLYVGGLAGFARYILIDASETSGTYSKSYISYNAYVGGLVGYAQSSTIQNSGSFMNLNLSVSNTNNKYIGAIVGRISLYNNVSAEITNCYSNVYVEGQEETVVSTTQVVVAMFGSAAGANVQGNYYKEEQ